MKKYVAAIILKSDIEKPLLHVVTDPFKASDKEDARVMAINHAIQKHPTRHVISTIIKRIKKSNKPLIGEVNL